MLDPSKQSQDHDDDQDCAEEAARSVAPPGAIAPGWEGANQKKNSIFGFLILGPISKQDAGYGPQIQQHMLLIGSAGCSAHQHAMATT
jgi:hypothetical protein